MNRSYRLFILLTALLLAASQATATLTRVRSLGGNLNYLEDDAGATVWYAPLLDYPDQIVLDVGDLNHDASGSLNQSLTHSAGSFHARLDEAGKWGTIGVYVQEDLPQDAPGGGATLLAARQFGKVGIGLKGQFTSHFEGFNSTETDGTGESLYFHAYGLGARWDVSDGVYGDIAGEIVNVQGDAASQDLWHLSTQQTWTTWGARTRWFIGLSETTVLVPVFDHRQDDRQVYDDIIAAPADQHARRTTAGLGFNLLPDPDNLVVISAEYRWGLEQHDRLDGNSTAWEYDYSELVYNEGHVRVGLESRVLPWLTVRGALEYYRLQQERLATRGETVPGEADRWAEAKSIEVLTPITLGFGFHFGSFQADLLLNARWSETYGTFPFGPQTNERGTYSALTLGYRF